MDHIPFSSPDLGQMRQHAAEFCQVDDTYFYARLKSGSLVSNSSMLKEPIRMEGLTVMVMMAGNIELEVNLKHYQLSKYTLAVLGPNTMLNFKADDWENVDIYLIFLTRRFLQDININMTSIYLPSLIESRTPVLSISEHETRLLLKYIDLFKETATNNINTSIERNIASSLLSALFYQMVQFQYRRMDISIEAGDNAHSKKFSYVQDFLKLVHNYYLTERSVKFYANKLALSSKYLSVLVREATGRSPRNWIDEFVGMEAKTMLRYSGKNIQQIAFNLNFPTQSSFGKFFKNLTGLTPSQYQNS